MVKFGVDKETESSIAKMLNCKVGQLPMKYLGFPISHRRLGAGVFDSITGKMRSRLQPWKGKNLTSVGRLTLTNTSLSSMHIYMMSMFQLYEGSHHQMTQSDPNFMGE